MSHQYNSFLGKGLFSNYRSANKIINPSSDAIMGSSITIREPKERKHLVAPRTVIQPRSDYISSSPSFVGTSETTLTNSATIGGSLLHSISFKSNKDKRPQRAQLIL